MEENLKVHIRSNERNRFLRTFINSYFHKPSIYIHIKSRDLTKTFNEEKCHSIEFIFKVFELPQTFFGTRVKLSN